MKEQIKSLTSGELTMLIKRDIMCLIDDVESLTFRGGVNDSDPVHPTSINCLVTLSSPRAWEDLLTKAATLFGLSMYAFGVMKVPCNLVNSSLASKKAMKSFKPETNLSGTRWICIEMNENCHTSIYACNFEYKYRSYSCFL